MIKYHQIKSVHIELTTNCNASCPGCPRNLRSMPYNAGYPKTELSLSDIKTIFDTDFIKQLGRVFFNGNFGDFMLAKDSLAIVEYFKYINPNIKIEINTNGSARPSEYWAKLGNLGAQVNFALDGLEDSHHLYRRNTNFNLIIKNASTLIANGGSAIWKMIVFDHNRHQIDECKQLSQSLGFSGFMIGNDNRDDVVVYNYQGEIEYLIGKPEPNIIVPADTYLGMAEEGYTKFKSTIDEINPIKCKAKKTSEIFIAANGEVSPCCWFGFYPRTYNIHHYRGLDQIKNLLDNISNNALELPLSECIEWFAKVESTWEKQSLEDGRLVICSSVCSSPCGR